MTFIQVLDKKLLTKGYIMDTYRINDCIVLRCE